MKRLSAHIFNLAVVTLVLMICADEDVGAVVGSPWLGYASLALIGFLYFAVWRIWRRERRGEETSRDALKVFFGGLVVAGSLAIAPGAAWACSCDGLGGIMGEDCPENAHHCECAANTPNGCGAWRVVTKDGVALTRPTAAGQEQQDPIRCDACLKAQENPAKGNSWATDVFIVLFTSMDTLATTTFDALAGGCAKLLAAAGLIYIAFVVLQIFIPVQDIGADYIDKLVKFLFKLLVAATLLNFGGEAFDLIVNPIVGLCMELTMAIMNGTPSGEGGPSVSLPEAAEKTLMGREILEKIAKAIQGIHEEVTNGRAMASTMWCLGLYKKTGYFLLFKYDISMILFGSMLWVGYTLLLVMYPLFIVDAVVRMLFVLAFFPVFIVLWVFGVTTEYTKKAFDILLNSCFTFLFSAVIVKIILTMYAVALGGAGESDISGQANDLIAACLVGGPDEDGLRYQAFEKILSGGSNIARTLMIAAIAYASWKALKNVEELVEKFSAKTVSFTDTKDSDMNKSAWPMIKTLGAMGGGLAKKAIAPLADKAMNSNKYARAVYRFGQHAGHVLSTGGVGVSPDPKYDISGKFKPSDSYFSERASARLNALLASAFRDSGAFGSTNNPYFSDNRSFAVLPAAVIFNVVKSTHDFAKSAYEEFKKP
jgi:hypothetical protein